jgi:hypothetical protein
MQLQTWAWLIGMSDAGDARLLQWAHSFAKPPALELHGARPASEPYSPERRASRLIVEDHMVTIGIKPAAVCVNPVFELEGVAKELLSIELAGRALDAKHFAWDGKTLWIDSTLTQDTQLQLRFGNAR